MSSEHEAVHLSSTRNKRVKEEVSKIDRLSALPDSIITHILSRLCVDDSAITAVLSRRWRFLWSKSPELHFIQGDFLVHDFVGRVNRTLVARGPDCLKQFVVKFRYSKPFSPDVNAWVEFAVKNQVKEVAFFLKTLGVSGFYVLPQLMCSSSSLVSLGIKGCIISPRRTIDWPSLTELYIKGVEVQQQSIEKILTGGCPVLAELTLKECWGFNSLDIKSERLIWLKIRDRFDHKGIPLLEISAPYLQNLKVCLSSSEQRKLRLTNISSDVTANIEFIEFDDSVEMMNNAREILGNIQHVKQVKLGGNYLEVLSSVAIKYGYDQFPQSTSRTSLKVYSYTRDELGNIHSILGLLKSSPNLQELVIEGRDEFETGSYNFTSANGDQVSDLLQLKTVIIKNFVSPNHAGEPMLTLVRILLKRTLVLEKIVIYVNEIAQSSAALDLLTILETLLGYQRSSPKASILLR